MSLIQYSSGALKSSAKLNSSLSGKKSALSFKSDKNATEVTENDISNNPFRMPSDDEIFVLRDKERRKRKEEREKMNKAKVHEKMTYTSRVSFRKSAMLDSEEDEEDVNGQDGLSPLKDDPQFTFAVTKNRHVQKETLAEYIKKKREMFVIQYSLGVKRDEMRKLDEIASSEEKKLELAEQYLEEDAFLFDEFLKQNDKNSVDAIKKAEEETKKKLDKVAQIKKVNTQITSVRSEIAKYEDTLMEYKKYKAFLEALTPQEWLDEKNERKIKRRQERERKQLEESLKVQNTSDFETVSQISDSKASRSSVTNRRKSMVRRSTLTKKVDTRDSTKKGISTDINPTLTKNSYLEDSDSEPELYFKDSRELLAIFTELEEQNLSLIQNSQETEESLEEMKQQLIRTKQKMSRETKDLKDQIIKLNSAIQKEEEKASELETKARMYSFGEYNHDAQARMLKSLNSKVSEVYCGCIGDNEANIDTLQMLTNIENRLEELFETIDMMPQDKVEFAERQKEKERRLRQREEKLREQKLHQEERVRKALERARAEPKKQTGRRLVFRSEPPRMQKKSDQADDKQTREEEELAYYFRY